MAVGGCCMYGSALGIGREENAPETPLVPPMRQLLTRNKSNGRNGSRRITRRRINLGTLCAVYELY